MSWWHGSWYGNSDWQGDWVDDWWQSWTPERGWSSEAWRGQGPEQSSWHRGRGFTRPGTDTGSTKGKGRGFTRPGADTGSTKGKGRGFTRPATGTSYTGAQASQPAGRPDEPDDQYVYAVLPFSLKDDWPPNSYAQVQEEIVEMGCHIATRARKKKGNKKEIRVTVKGQMAQDAFDLFCQRAQELSHVRLIGHLCPSEGRLGTRRKRQCSRSRRSLPRRTEPFVCCFIITYFGHIQVY